MVTKPDKEGAATGTGVAYVRFANPGEAERARKERHRERMGARYIECLPFTASHYTSPAPPPPLLAPPPYALGPPGPGQYPGGPPGQRMAYPPGAAALRPLPRGMPPGQPQLPPQQQQQYYAPPPGGPLVGLARGVVAPPGGGAGRGAGAGAGAARGRGRGQLGRPQPAGAGGVWPETSGPAAQPPPPPPYTVQHPAPRPGRGQPQARNFPDSC